MIEGEQRSVVQRAILIDATEQVIRDVTYTDYRGLQQLLHGGLEVAFQWPNGDVLYVNDFGMSLPNVRTFNITVRTDQPMFGNGVVVGREIEDEDVVGGYYTADPEMTVELLRTMVRFRSRL